MAVRIEEFPSFGILHRGGSRVDFEGFNVPLYQAPQRGEVDGEVIGMDKPGQTPPAPAAAPDPDGAGPDGAAPPSATDADGDPTANE